MPEGGKPYTKEGKAAAAAAKKKKASEGYRSAALVPIKRFLTAGVAGEKSGPPVKTMDEKQAAVRAHKAKVDAAKAKKWDELQAKKKAKGPTNGKKGPTLDELLSTDEWGGPVLTPREAVRRAGRGAQEDRPSRSKRAGELEKKRLKALRAAYEKYEGQRTKAPVEPTQPLERRGKARMAKPPDEREK